MSLSVRNFAPILVPREAAFHWTKVQCRCDDVPGGVCRRPNVGPKSNGVSARLPRTLGVAESAGRRLRSGRTAGFGRTRRAVRRTARQSRDAAIGMDSPGIPGTRSEDA